MRRPLETDRILLCLVLAAAAVGLPMDSSGLLLLSPLTDLFTGILPRDNDRPLLLLVVVVRVAVGLVLVVVLPPPLLLDRLLPFSSLKGAPEAAAVALVLFLTTPRGLEAERRFFLSSSKLLSPPTNRDFEAVRSRLRGCCSADMSMITGASPPPPPQLFRELSEVDLI